MTVPVLGGARELDLTLPATFRSGDILAFHRRDGQQVAERVSEFHLEKGLVWRGAPACLSLRFTPGRVLAGLSSDGAGQVDDEIALAAMVRRMLGLTQDVAAFETRHRRHPQIGSLIARQSGLRVPVTATVFEALSWAITGQQISVTVAVSLRRRLIQAVAIRHSGGLFCYPSAVQVAGLSEERLREAGFSATKARTLLTVSRLVSEGALPLENWAQSFPGEDLVRTQLQAVRGIGPWTVNYTLLRGFGRLDGSLHGDAAVRRGLQILLGSGEKLGEKEAEGWLAQFSPWRALVGAHLWALQSSAGDGA